ncbi:MAG: molybdenum cofactor guanylyltransferase [Kofleriaceae bacterium]
MIDALILAGGRATRFGGIAKHELVIDGERIIDRQAALLHPRVREILVSAREPVSGFRTVQDYLGEGPLAGIAAGLQASDAERLLVIAGDMPDVTGELLDRLIAGSGTVGVKIDDRIEPLACVVIRSLLPEIEDRLRTNRWSVGELLTASATTWLTDLDSRWLRNVNSPADLRE